jgi:hypothetical protein
MLIIKQYETKLVSICCGGIAVYLPLQGNLLTPLRHVRLRFQLLVWRRHPHAVATPGQSSHTCEIYAALLPTYYCHILKPRSLLYLS